MPLLPRTKQAMWKFRERHGNCDCFGSRKMFSHIAQRKVFCHREPREKGKVERRATLHAPKSHAKSRGMCREARLFVFMLRSAGETLRENDAGGPKLHFSSLSVCVFPMTSSERLRGKVFRERFRVLVVALTYDENEQHKTLNKNRSWEAQKEFLSRQKQHQTWLVTANNFRFFFLCYFEF